jgi:hypothetical protein
VNAGVALVRAYLRVNGYLVLEEMPVVLPEKIGGYRTHTDLDIVAVRFPCVRMGAPDAAGRIANPIATDPKLDVPEGAIDVIIGEVKEGRAHMNRAIRSPEALRLGLARVGVCDEQELEKAADSLSEQAVVRIESCEPVRQVRLVAFGMGTSRKTHTHYVVSLKDAWEFVDSIMERGHEMLLPASVSDPVLGLLHLANKLR